MSISATSLDRMIPTSIGPTTLEAAASMLERGQSPSPRTTNTTGRKKLKISINSKTGDFSIELDRRGRHRTLFDCVLSKSLRGIAREQLKKDLLEFVKANPKYGWKPDLLSEILESEDITDAELRKLVPTMGDFLLRSPYSTIKMIIIWNKNGTLHSVYPNTSNANLVHTVEALKRGYDDGTILNLVYTNTNKQLFNQVRILNPVLRKRPKMSPY